MIRVTTARYIMILLAAILAFAANSAVASYSAPEKSIPYLKMWGSVDPDSYTLTDDSLAVHNLYPLKFYWPIQTGIAYMYYEFLYRSPGDTNWNVHRVDSPDNSVVLRDIVSLVDLEEIEIGVRVCNPKGCTAEAVYPHIIQMDFPEITVSSNIRNMYFDLYLGGRRYRNRNYCHADPETLKCEGYINIYVQMQPGRGGLRSFYDGRTYLADKRASSAGGTVAYYNYSNLDIGTHSITWGGTTNGLNSARKRFHVYIPATGSIQAIGCEINPTDTSCQSQVTWQFEGDFPTCLYKTDGTQTVEVACSSKGPFEADVAVELTPSLTSFEIRSKEPAGERTIANATASAAYKDISFTTSLSHCAIIRPETSCTVRVNWSSSDEYSACVFNKTQLLACSLEGEVDVIVPLGGANFTVRNGNGLEGMLLAKADVTASRAPTGTMKIVSGYTNPCAPGADGTCEIEVEMEHWGSSGTILYKDDRNWGDLSSSAHTVPVSFTHKIKAEASGTHYSMRSMYNGVMYEFASIDLYPSSSYPGYSLTADSPECTYDPLTEMKCESRVYWSLPEAGACIFLNNNEVGFCPNATMLSDSSAQPRQKGVYRYQLKKGTTLTSELLAQVTVPYDKKQE